MSWPLFQIVKQLTPVTSRPYWIIEIYMTSDGPRTRICDGHYETEAQAEAALEGKKGLSK